MPVVDVYNQKHEPVSTIELDEEVFAAEVKEHLFHLMVRYQLAKRRAGTHNTRTRSDVSGGGKKPFRQKGTGRARAGTTRAVQWRGGGVVHGPQRRSHAIKVPKKVRKAAMRSAISRRLEDGAFWVIDKIELDAIKTKKMVEIMEHFGWDEVLMVIAGDNPVVVRSSRNIPNLTVLPTEGLNVYDILKHRHLAITVDAIPQIIERYGR